MYSDVCSNNICFKFAGPPDQTKFDTFVTVCGLPQEVVVVVPWCGAIPLGNYVEATASALGNTQSS